MADRPPNTNPESAATRGKLLDAAERLFAERGFRSASVRDITREAECNIASVNYHFGGKLALYQEVFMRRLRDLRGRRLEVIERSRGAGLTLEGLLGQFAAAFIDPLVAEGAGRRWVLLVAQELIDPQLPAGTFQGEMIEPMERALGDALIEACPGLAREDAVRAIHSLIGQLLHLVNLQRCLRREHVPGELASEVEHTVRFSAAGIRALQRVPA